MNSKRIADSNVVIKNQFFVINMITQKIDFLTIYDDD